MATHSFQWHTYTVTSVNTTDIVVYYKLHALLWQLFTIGSLQPYV